MQYKKARFKPPRIKAFRRTRHNTEFFEPATTTHGPIRSKTAAKPACTSFANRKKTTMFYYWGGLIHGTTSISPKQNSTTALFFSGFFLVTFGGFFLVFFKKKNLGNVQLRIIGVSFYTVLLLRRLGIFCWLYFWSLCLVSNLLIFW